MMSLDLFGCYILSTLAYQPIYLYTTILKVNTVRMEDFVKILDSRTEEDEGILGNIRGSGSLFKQDMYLNVRDPLCHDACQGKIMAALNSRRDYFSVKSQVPQLINLLWSIALPLEN